MFRFKNLYKKLSASIVLFIFSEISFFLTLLLVYFQNGLKTDLGLDIKLFFEITSINYIPSSIIIILVCNITIAYLQYSLNRGSYYNKTINIVMLIIIAIVMVLLSIISLVLTLFSNDILGKAITIFIIPIAILELIAYLILLFRYYILRKKH